MNALARFREAVGERDWIPSIVAVVGIVGLGVLLGQQYLMPDKRVIAVSAALVLFGLAWRIDMVSALGGLIIAIPFPRGTVFGTTNLAFILLLMVVWLLRFTQRHAAGPQRTPADTPIAGLILAYVLSFYNVTEAESLNRGLTLTWMFLSCLLMFYLIVINVRSERDLRRLHGFQVGGIALIYAFCLWEMFFPGHTLIAGWLDYKDINIGNLRTGSYRVGGPWLDYELLSEWLAMNLVFFIFLTARAQSVTRRALFAILLVVTALLEFSTVTRGGITAFVGGLAYLLFLMRRRLNIVPLTIIGVVAVILVGILTTLLKQFTNTADIFARFSETRFVNGLPDSRAEVWPQAWERMLQHPLIGHGPYYSAERGLQLWFWPHNLPLFIGNCFGFLGLAMFLWLMVTFWKMSRPATDRLDDPSYLRAFTLAARVQLLIFFIDETKIEYLRNPTYQYMPWILFSTITATAVILGRERQTAAAPTAEPARPSVLAPAPVRP